MIVIRCLEFAEKLLDEESLSSDSHARLFPKEKHAFIPEETAMGVISALPVSHP